MIIHQEKTKPVDNERLDKFMNDSQTIFTKLEDVATIRMAANDITGALENVKRDNENVNGFLKDTKEIIDKLVDVTAVTADLKKEIAARDVKMNETIVNSLKALHPLKSFEEQVSKLFEEQAAKFWSSSKPDFQPSVRPKESNQPSNSEKSGSVMNAAKENTNADIQEVAIRKGLFLTSSIGLRLDMYDLQEQLESEVTAVKTYYIEKNETAENPEMNLRDNLKTEIDKDIDFMIIATGSNDISSLSVDDRDMSDLTTAACDHSRNLVQQAHEASQKHNIDVFVVERPPRGDSNIKFSQLNVAANGMLPSLTIPLEKVHFIPLPSLNNLPDKSKKNLFTNKGIHLKPWGSKLMRNDILAGVRSVFKDINLDHIEKFPKDGKNKPAPDNVNNDWQDPQTSGRNENEKRNSNAGGRPIPSRSNDNNSGYNSDRNRSNQHEQFHNPTSKRREETFLPPGRRMNAQESFHPPGRFQREDRAHRAGDNRNNHNNRKQSQSPNNRRYNGSDERPTQWQKNRGRNERNNHGGSRGGQQDEQMPELVREYLKTCIRDGNGRY